MIDILTFISELKTIKEQLQKGKLLTHKATYDVLKTVQNGIDKYEKKVEEFEKEYAPPSCDCAMCRNGTN